MRLLYITNQICGSGGLERVLSIKASYLADKLGYEVHIVTLNQGNIPLFYNFSEKLIYHDINVKGTLLSYCFNYVKKLNRIIKGVDPDLISVCDDGLKGLFFPPFLSKNIPIIYERHVPKKITIDQLTGNKLIKKIKKIFINGLMNYSSTNYNEFILLTKGNEYDWPFISAITIPNPLPFEPDRLSDLKNKDILVVGRHAEYKGYDILLQIWKEVVEIYPEWQLNVYGKFDPSEKYQNMAKSLNIDNSVKFYHPVKNIDEKFQSSSIYVMTSRFEGFGMVLIEAMSFGLPCISFDCPYGPKDIIDDGKNGFLIDNGDVDQFINKLKILIENSELRRKMGYEAKNKANTYSVRYIMPLWDRLFKKLVHA